MGNRSRFVFSLVRAMRAERTRTMVRTRKISGRADAAAMGAETRAETYEPKITRVGGGSRFLERFLEREKHGRAAHIAVSAKDAGTGVERMRSDDGRERFEDIAASGVGDDARDRTRTAGGPETVHGAGGEFG